MGKRRLHPQEKDNTCAVASVRTVLDLQFGVQIGEEALEALGTSASEPIAEIGSLTHHLHRMVRQASFALNNSGKRWRITIYQRGTLAGLERYCERGLHPLVTVMNPAALHMIVVLRIAKGRVWYFDPSGTQAKWMSERRFIAWWLQPDGTSEYGIIRGGAPLENTSTTTTRRARGRHVGPESHSAPVAAASAFACSDCAA